MMSKSLLIRPHLMALYASCPPPVFFSSSSRRSSYQTTKPSYLSITPRGVTLSQSKALVSIVAAGGLRSLSVRATTQVNNSGSIDSPLMESMQKKIKEHLNAESVTVMDAYGDGRHVSIDVISSAFEGQSAVNRQRMVYKAIWEELQNTVHAVDQMTTRTPSEAAASS